MLTCTHKRNQLTHIKYYLCYLLYFFEFASQLTVYRLFLIVLLVCFIKVIAVYERIELKYQNYQFTRYLSISVDICAFIVYNTGGHLE